VSIVDVQSDEMHAYPFHIFDAEPPDIHIPTLQELAADAKSDQEIVDRVVAYYQQNKNELATAWRETDPDRVKAFLAMYLIHISHRYGYNTFAKSFIEYIKQRTTSECSSYAFYQSRILDGLGLKWQHVIMTSGIHGWIEVKIGNQWEIFDATSNVWINQSGFDLIQGKPRQYRFFYTPWMDFNQPTARQVNLDFGQTAEDQPIYGTPGTLRSEMAGLGLYYFTEAYRQSSGDKLQIYRTNVQ
jgi:hypothetical protein